MHRIKILLLPLLLVLFCGNNFAASFTYSGPSSATISFGHTNVSATYYFSYDLTGLFMPALSIAVDGNTILAPHACQSDATTPSHYALSFNSPGTHSVMFRLTQLVDNGTPCGTRVTIQEYNFNVSVNFQISVENIFAGGTIKVDNTIRSSPYHRSVSGDNNVPIDAIEQDNGGYHWIWNANGTNNSEWDKIPSGGNSTRYSFLQNTTYSVQSTDISTRVVAGLRKICNLTFQNNFVGVGNSGTITVGGSQYNSPASGFNVIEQNPIIANANESVINGISYFFIQWSNGSTSKSTTFYPGQTNTYTASFYGRPYKANFNFGFDLVVGQPIRMHWTDNPNTNVTYQIWRCTDYSHGVAHNPSQIATVQRGVQSFTDNDYTYMGPRSGSPVYYDVREYYSVEGTTSYESWYGTNGNLVPKISAPSESKMASEIKEYSVICYPNPFNPSTRINYQLPKDGMVSLKIYNELGQEVKTLVDGFKNTGTYNIEFNASNLSSGIYFYKLQAGDFVSIKKMLLIK